MREAAGKRGQPDPDKRTCFDSDAKLGDEAIYQRGYVDVGTARVTDHCRSDQLVEFYCIENPPGSGRFLEDAKFVNCPAGSRCVSAECLK